MIQLRNIFKSYRIGERNIPILKDVSLNIAQGEFVAIMGQSGSGKSTLLNIIGCLDTAERGSYRLGDSDISSVSDRDLAIIRNRLLGFVFQFFNLIPSVNALRNVELPLVYAGVPAAKRRQRAYEALCRIGLGHRIEHTPAQLSGGQQQRVAIARALVNDPAVLIADEPTGSLDSQAGRDVMELLQSLNESGKTIVMVTHERDLATYAGRMIYLHDGMIHKDTNVARC